MNPEIFIHVGLHKTGTTFFQKKIFPIWPNMEYSRGRDTSLLIRTLRKDKIIISDENLSGTPWGIYNIPGKSWSFHRKQALINLSRIFPEAKILISFRQHSSFLQSLYRQYIQSGGTGDFELFFKLNSDKTLIKESDLHFKSILELIDGNFSSKPFVFTQDELKTDIHSLLESMGKFIGEPPPDFHPTDNRSGSNQSVSSYPAQILRFTNRLFRTPLNPDGLIPINRATRVLSSWPRKICQHYLSLLLKEPLRMSESLTNLIDSHYASDWEYIKQRSQERLY